MAKANPKEHFDDLDLISKVLVRNEESTQKKPIIEELDSGGTPAYSLTGTLDWSTDNEKTNGTELDEVKYGFNCQYSGFFAHVQEVSNEINEIASPESTSRSMRKEIRIENENDKFDPDYYLADYATSSEISGILAWITPYGTANAGILDYTPQHTNQMLLLSKRNCLLFGYLF